MDLIMECIASVSYVVMVNGKSGDTSMPTRGLRQGDLLLAYLFLLCAKRLSTLIN